MSDTERLAAIGRILVEMQYIDVRETVDKGKRWVVLDGSSWVPADDAQALLDLVREHAPNASWRDEHGESIADVLGAPLATPEEISAGTDSDRPIRPANL